MRKRIMIGCDPEFELINNTNAVQAAEEVIKGDVCRKRIGADGAGDALEFRPRPALRSKTLVKHLRSLFKRFKQTYPGFEISVCGDTFAIGGHIHFGVGAPYVPSVLLLQLFDAVIGEVAMDKSGEARNSYRNLSKYKSNRHGFEYRTPSAALFRKPEYVEVGVKLLQAAFSYYIAQRSRVEARYAIHDQSQELADSIRDRVLDDREKKIYAEFVDYKPTQENILSYWC